MTMRQLAETWAVVLAGGEGSRLRKITTNRQGLVVPKQYCSLKRAPCLLQDAVTRARSFALPSHICTVVAAQHRRWWISAVAELNASNVFVQPRNKGTGLGILLALVTLELRNPAATLVLLPADHYFRDEDTVSRALRAAGNMACANGTATYLIGAEPTSADPELGYILPAERVLDKPESITGFKEKPTPEHAQELLSQGALWNLFILVGSVGALLQLFAEDHADLVRDMRAALKAQLAGQSAALNDFYERIEPVDFSKDVLEVHANRLQVLRVPSCGWTDLGTPQRVETALRSFDVGPVESTKHPENSSPPLFFDLGAHRF
jgi:mannose-1-phosphate guanylyltransferase